MASIKIRKAPEASLPYNEEVEIVERKGIGHPDSICDFLAEEVSIALSKYYYKNFGYVMHHNVDKALLIGGIANPRYNGGKIIKPIKINVIGRATDSVNGNKIAIEDIAKEAMYNWLKENIINLDENNHVVLETKIRPGSKNLVGLFEKFARKQEIPLANDTSFGVGFYPFDTLETIVYNIEKHLNDKKTKNKYPFLGEDIKVMGVRKGNNYKITIAAAIVDKYISSIEEYKENITKIKEIINNKILKNLNENIEIFINTADDYANDNVYLTVTGTSAEQGDDGQVGRGNRVNGLITPYRPMSLEAAAGKNPISHVGKIYNFFANDLAKKIVEEGYAKEALVYVVSQIGKPITHPQILDIKLVDYDKGKEKEIRDLAEYMLNNLPNLWEDIVIKRKYQVV